MQIIGELLTVSEISNTWLLPQNWLTPKNSSITESGCDETKLKSARQLHVHGLQGLHCKKQARSNSKNWPCTRWRNFSWLSTRINNCHDTDFSQNLWNVQSYHFVISYLHPSDIVKRKVLPPQNYQLLFTIFSPNGLLLH